MSKHTKGRWEHAEAGRGTATGQFVIDEYFVRVVEDDVAIASEIIDPETGLPSEANARLIAAAPDLLIDLIDGAAQLRAYEILHRAKNTEESTAKADVNAALAARFEATIAKARGES